MPGSRSTTCYGALPRVSGAMLDSGVHKEMENTILALVDLIL